MPGDIPDSHIDITEDISVPKKVATSPEAIQEKGERSANQIKEIQKREEEDKASELISDPIEDYPPADPLKNTETVTEENESEPSSDDFVSTILSAPKYSNQPAEVRAQIQKLVEGKLAEKEEMESMGIEFELSISDITTEIDDTIELKESVSVENEFKTRRDFLLGPENNKSKLETIKILLQEFKTKGLEPAMIDQLEGFIKVHEFANTLKSPQEKNIIQSTLESADVFSAGGLAIAMHQIYSYSSEDISEETKKQLAIESGVAIPQQDFKTTSDLYEGLEKKDDERRDQIKKLRKQESELTKRKETLENKPTDELTAAELSELKKINTDLSTIQDTKETLENEQGKDTRRAILNGTVEMKGNDAVFKIGSESMTVDMRKGFLGINRKRQHLDISTFFLGRHLDEGNGARKPLFLEKAIYGDIGEGKPVSEEQRDISKEIMNSLGVGKKGELLTALELRKVERTFNAFRDPDRASGNGPEGAMEDFRTLGLLQTGEKKLSASSGKRLGGNDSIFQ